MDERVSAIAVRVDTKEEEAVRRMKRRRSSEKKNGAGQETAPQEGAEEQEVEDTKTTKKDLAKTGWHRGAEVIVCLLLWLWGTWTLEARGSQDRRSWPDRNGVELQSGANRRAAEGVDRKGVRGSLHVHYSLKRGVGVVGVGVVLEVATQDLVRGQLG